MRKRIYQIIFLIAVIGMLVSGFLLLSSYGRDYFAMRYWKKIAAQKEDYGDWTGQDILPQYQSLYDENPDMVGWLYIEGLHIDYPVMQTKDDPEYYLRRNFDQEDDWSGTPFVDYRCGVLPVKGFNTVIYGHNNVFRYLFDYAYKRRYPEYRYIRFDTLREEGLYELVAVFYADGTDALLLDPWDAEDDQAYSFYNYLEVDSIEGFQRFKSYVEENRLFETEAELTMDSHILTLICCAAEPYSGIEENGRLVVIAKQVKP